MPSPIDRGPFAGVSIAALVAMVGVSSPAAVAAAPQSGTARVQQSHETPASPASRRPMGVLSGHVRHEFTKDGINGAKVVAISESTGAHYTTWSRGESGRFTFELPQDTYTISVTDSDRIPYGAGGVRVLARRTSTIVATLGTPVMGEVRRAYPVEEPPPLGELDPRDAANSPPSSSLGRLWDRVIENLRDLVGR
jgi:hypothetical protein